MIQIFIDSFLFFVEILEQNEENEDITVCTYSFWNVAPIVLFSPVLLSEPYKSSKYINNSQN